MEKFFNRIKKMKLKIFTEYHHGGLLHALSKLFEVRLGGEIYAPVGYEWYTKGYWKLSENPETIRQYLDINQCAKTSDGIFAWHDKAEGYTQKRITFEQFKKVKFDLIICTLQQHETTYNKLWRAYQPQAKYIRLAGNWGERINYNMFKNFIDTTGLYKPPKDINAVVIHQEFDTEIFNYQEPKNHKTIKNFMNQLKESKAYPIWKGLKRELPDFNFKMHGAGGEDGNIEGLQKLAEAMRDAAFIFQIKHHGEGYGHVIHNAYAVGRPVITMIEHYRGKLAEKLLIDGVSAIFADNLTMEELAEKIRYWSEPERHLEMSRNAHQLFKKYVNFDEDEKKIRSFLKKLK